MSVHIVYMKCEQCGKISEPLERSSTFSDMPFPGNYDTPPGWVGYRPEPERCPTCGHSALAYHMPVHHAFCSAECRDQWITKRKSL